jgi:hypothetical protein
MLAEVNQLMSKGEQQLTPKEHTLLELLATLIFSTSLPISSSEPETVRSALVLPALPALQIRNILR